MSVFLHQFGIRVTIFTGGLVSAGGLFICAYATSIYHVIILLGVLSGEDPIRVPGRGSTEQGSGETGGERGTSSSDLINCAYVNSIYHV